MKRTLELQISETVSHTIYLVIGEDITEEQATELEALNGSEISEGDEMYQIVENYRNFDCYEVEDTTITDVTIEEEED
jgi:hypothetical protein